MRSGFKYNPKYNLAVLTCVVLAVYWPILGNDFLNYWDDQWYVMSRYTEGGLNLANFRSMFSEFYAGQYSPVNKLMYLLIYSVFGYNSMVFHLASLLLHAACVCLAYIIILRILKYSGENTVITFLGMKLNGDADGYAHYIYGSGKTHFLKNLLLSMNIKTL